MHLVVLKRNQIELPTTLPPSLMPYMPASSEPFAADLDEEEQRRSPSPPPPTQQKTSWPGTNTTESAAGGNWSAENQWKEQQGGAGSDQWTDQVGLTYYALYFNMFHPEGNYLTPDHNLSELEMVLI